MIEEIVDSYEVLSDGRCVWVNSGVTGASVARFGTFAGIGVIDVHRAVHDQAAKGECLDCSHGPLSLELWQRFKDAMRRHYLIDIPDKHKPAGIR